MKRYLPLVLTVTALTLPSWLALGADTAEEDQQIAILQSDHSPAEKDAACARLKWIGDAKCVPVLAPLLTDDQLSHSARYALESLPGPEAEAALRAALLVTSGSNRVGVINSLGARRETDAVPDLSKLLSETDTIAACAAAMALGRINGPAAAEALQSAWSDTATGPLHEAEIDGLLACAEKLLTQGENPGALKIFKHLYDTGKSDKTRQAAFCGVILASGHDGIALMAQGIAGNDGASQGAALQVATDPRLKGTEATRALADLLPQSGVAVQIALLTCLAQREDPSALSAVKPMADSSDSDVRQAALKALAELGDGSVALLLAQKAATLTGAEKGVARQALLDLRRGEVTPALLDALTTAPPEVKAELIRALGNRGDLSAVPKLLTLASGTDDALRSSCLQALALLAGSAQLPDLVQLAIRATSDDARSQAADTISSVCQRVISRTGHCDTEALVQAVRTGPIEARIALLPVCSGLSEAPVREALRASLQDPMRRVREAGQHALCDTRDAELLPDLLTAAADPSDQKLRLMAIRGCVRLVTEEENVKLTDEQRLNALKTILDKPLAASEKILVLSGLGAIKTAQSLALAGTMLEDAAVKAEAAQAIIHIAESLAASRPEEAGAALVKVIATITDPALLDAAKEAQKKIWKATGYATLWQVAGPYMQQGKEFSALFDMPFAPETGEASSVHWQTLPASTQPGQSWKMDLLQAIGGEQRVAYARTWIKSPKKQNLRMELGSDDGVKVWLNDHVVYGNNASRGLEPNSDKVNITLNKGWNSVMLKVTQNNAGWAFCVRLVQPGGEPVDGLQFSLSPDTAQR